MKNSLLTTPNILFAALSAVFFAFAFRPLPPPALQNDDVVEHHSPDPVERNDLSLRAQQYRQQLAMKLNRQRVETEYEATFSSRSGDQQQKISAHDDDLAFGVEAIRKHSSQDVAVDQSTAEMQVRADANRRKQERRQEMRGMNPNARAQFIAQYIANARAEGYEVTVDAEFNVQVVRGPEANDGRGPQSVEDDGPANGRILAAFIHAPFCH